jgi:hypothetical protein
MAIEIKYKEIDKKKGRALIKLSFGQYYVITKCGEIGFIDNEIRTMHKRYLHNRDGIPTNGLYFRLIETIYKQELEFGIVEVLLQTTNGYDLLKAELKLLEDHYSKKYCLNSNNIPYIPKTVHANKGSNWLTQNEYLNFMKLLKKYDY